MNRRDFLVGSVSMAALACAAESADTALPPPPPGSGSVRELMRRCTGCGLCLARCPSNVLKAAGLEYGLAGVMMPRMDFARGFCRPDCSACGEACPAGAIRRFAVEEKKSMRQAVAVHARADCLVAKEGLKCGNCAEHCPYRALSMAQDADGRAYPKVDAALCTGCGACEYHCPVKAIRIVGRRSPDEEVAA